MLRSLVRGAALLSSLVALSLALAPTAPAATGGTGSQRHVEIQMRVGAFQVEVTGSDQNGSQSANLYVSRRDEFAQYVVPAEFTDNTLKAKFGLLGELDYQFAPKSSKDADCFGDVQGSEASFSGSLTFTGENGFIHIDAGNTSGLYYAYPEPPGCAPGRTDRAATTPRADTGSSYSGDGATLTATAKETKKGFRKLRALEVIGEKSGDQELFALVAEKDHGVAVLRGVQAAAPHVLEWDFDAGTASVRPPPPLTGSARLSRRADGSWTFTGSLRVPILGEPKPVAMVGSVFKAVVHHGTPPDQ
jgi:hypothetical protein